MGWLRKKAKQIGKGIKKLGSKIAGGIRKVTRSKAFKIIAAIALATIVGPAAWQTWGIGGTGTFAANLSAQTFAVTGGAFGTAAATSTTAAPAAVAGSTAAGTAATAPAIIETGGIIASNAAGTVPGSAAFNAAAAQSGTAASNIMATSAINTTSTQALAGASAPNVFTRVGTGIKNFAADHPLITTTAASVGGGLVLGLAQAALADDPRHRGAQVGESAQERSQLAALQAGYQAQYGRGAAQEMMLGMNFGYDSVGYQTTA
jgi:hypothetical protein